MTTTNSVDIGYTNIKDPHSNLIIINGTANEITHNLIPNNQVQIAKYIGAQNYFYEIGQSTYI